MDLIKKIQDELNKIHVSQKIKSGNFLTESDIKEVIKILKDKDIEVKPLLEIIESLLVKPEENYLIIEESIIKLLKYYNLLDNNNFMTCRHKYFFSENKKLIKTKYFTEEHTKDIKNKINNVYKKL